MASRRGRATLFFQRSRRMAVDRRRPRRPDLARRARTKTSSRRVFPLPGRQSGAHRSPIVVPPLAGLFQRTDLRGVRSQPDERTGIDDSIAVSCSRPSSSVAHWLALGGQSVLIVERQRDHAVKPEGANRMSQASWTTDAKAARAPGAPHGRAGSGGRSRLDRPSLAPAVIPPSGFTGRPS